MKKLRRALSALLLLATAFYGYQMADLYFNQSAHVYHPLKALGATPASVGLAYQDL